MMATALAEAALPAPLDALAARHETLRVTLQEVLDRVRSSSRISLGITGGAAVGLFDEYSDIDLVLAVDGTDVITEAMNVAQEVIAALGEPLVVFRADHLGASNMFVAYVRCAVGIVKTDILVLDVSAQPTLPDKFLVIHDVAGRFMKALPSRPGIDAESLLSKLTGWLWFSYTRIRRGELFAAARSLDFSREAALLPLMLDRLGLPQEGHRRLEARLPAALIAQLRATHPARLEPSALMDCLRSLHVLVIAEMEARPNESMLVLRRAADQIWSCVEASERTSGSG